MTMPNQRFSRTLRLYTTLLAVWMTLPAAAGAADTSVVTHPSASSPNLHAQRFALAQRQGRCQAMLYHIQTLERASDASQAQAAVRALTRLGAEMMSAYTISAASGGLSEPALHLDGAALEDVRRLRQHLLESLRVGKDGHPKALASTLRSQHEQLCHPRFIGDVASLQAGSDLPSSLPVPTNQ